nr:MAG: hypothetical protein [Molluscum contagiosum virus]
MMFPCSHRCECDCWWRSSSVLIAEPMHDRWYVSGLPRTRGRQNRKCQRPSSSQHATRVKPGWLFARGTGPVYRNCRS